MKTCTTVAEYRTAYRETMANGEKRVGFVPTMGALHEGHLSLARALKGHVDIRVCSIFVNPTQFNDPKDYEAYVINLESDKRQLEEEGVDILFAPAVSEIYPPGFQTAVTVSEIAKPFEGALRPGHFAGVATVVSLLFQIVRPHVAIFGEKDFQQLRLIERMVEDLKFDIEIVRGELVRDVDGLALSSRNARLSAQGRREALQISKGLFAAKAAFAAGERSTAVLEGLVVQSINSMSHPQIDYASLVDEETLAPVGPHAPERCRLLVVARVEGVRLLDNVGLAASPHDVKAVTKS
jgi:pantoate--beta-alanine ligase